MQNKANRQKPKAAFQKQTQFHKPKANRQSPTAAFQKQTQFPHPTANRQEPKAVLQNKPNFTAPTALIPYSFTLLLLSVLPPFPCNIQSTIYNLQSKRPISTTNPNTLASRRAGVQYTIYNFPPFQTPQIPPTPPPFPLSRRSFAKTEPRFRPTFSRKNAIKSKKIPKKPPNFPDPSSPLKPDLHYIPGPKIALFTHVNHETAVTGKSIFTF